ncbi:MAG: alcohol dehydrogenase family protein [Acidimicrobiales bacterium]
MAAVWLTGHGGLDRLEYRTDVPVPVPASGQVLVRVLAAGVNNTDINTRTGWYSKSVSSGTGEGSDGFGVPDDGDGAWSGEPLAFPLIQGADACGQVVAVGEGVDKRRVGDRVLIRALYRPDGAESPVAVLTYGSDSDGAFAQYTVCRSTDALVVDSDWTDEELASLPCAYSTAEGMLDRASVAAERVLITGASGGVGSAAIQLAKRRGAEVLAISQAAKASELRGIGADTVLDRADDLIDALGEQSVDVVLDVVGGSGFPALLDLLRPGGRYATVGAIAGPIVDLDLRTLYLKDLTLFGSTYQPDHVFENLVKYVEADEIRPLVAGTYPLSAIAEAQDEFLSKRHTGKLVLIPPPD